MDKATPPSDPVQINSLHDVLQGALEADAVSPSQQTSVDIGADTGASAPACAGETTALCINSGLKMGIAFQNLCVTVPDGAGGKKQILDGVSGRLKAGSFLALMGPTGSGKTTLINCLTRRHAGYDATGRVVYSTTDASGETREYAWSKDIKRQLAFVSQDDVVIEDLTVLQSLSFTARLRLPRQWSEARRAKQVALVMETLRIAKCRHTRIGQVSGGERKRVCIAQELLSQPAVIVLDEPTSGLDSTMALSVVRALKDIAHAGMTVLTSIHQPSSQIFAEFDDLILLNQGAMRYCGRARSVVPYFGALGLVCPPHFNPSDWAMDLLVAGDLERKDVLDRLRCDFGGSCDVDGGELDTERAKNQVSVQGFEHEDRYNLTWLEQLSVLTARVRTLQRTTLFTKDNVALYLGLAAIAGVIWFRLDYSERSIFHRVALSLWLIGTWTFFPMFNSMPVFPSFMDVLRHEVHAGQYRLSAFYISRALSTLPLELVFPTLYVAIVWWMASLNLSLASFLRGYLAILLNYVTMQAVGLCISAGVPEEKMVTFAILVITFFFGASGLFVESSRFPIWFGWTRHVNLLRYGYNLLMRQVFIPASGSTSDMDFACAESSAYDACRVTSRHQNATETTRITPAQVLHANDVEVETPVCIAVMVGATVLLHVVAYQCLRHRVLHVSTR